MTALARGRTDGAAPSGPYPGQASAAARPPVVTAYLGSKPLPDVVVVPDPERSGHWRVIISLPPIAPYAQAVADPFPAVVLRRAAGPVADDGVADEARDGRTDDAAELRLLRAEVDLLKRAFRRHCIETG